MSIASWKQRISYLSLLGSFTSLAFTIVGIVLAYGFSMMVRTSQWRERIQNLENWQILGILGILIFVVLTVILLIGDQLLSKGTKKWGKKIGQNVLLALSLLALILSLISSYFIFIDFFEYLNVTFWV